MSTVETRSAGFAYQAPQAMNQPPVTALHDLSLNLPPGSATLITGASGSGKSTALRLLNGLVPHLTGGELSGEVIVAGRNTRETPLHELGQVTGTVFQNPRTQFFTATTLEELAFALENAGTPAPEIEARVVAAARKAGISHLLHRALTELSGGELQLIACACVLATDAGILLLDEPTSNLSPDAIDGLRRLLFDLKASGLTLVIAEHRLHFLNGLVDTVVHLDHGRLVSVAPAAEFFAMTDADRRAAGLRTLAPPRLARADVALPDPVGGLAVRGLKFSYQAGRPVLDIASLTFPAGSVSALCGPNGAGKTTLARVLTGLAAQGAGEILLDGHATSQKQRQTASALVMQDVHRQLFGESVAAEVTLGLPPGARVEVPALLEELGLLDLADRHPMSLSGGQKQRLVVAAALASGARVYVFDEPTSGVDYRHLQAVSARIRSLAAAGHVVIVISHDPEFLAECADLIITISPYETGVGNRIDMAAVRREGTCDA